MKTVAIIPAGGTGRRMQGRTAKQYLHLNGLPILARTLDKFQRSEIIDAIFLVIPAADMEDVHAAIVERHGFTKVAKIFPGGRERQDSVWRGVSAVDQDVDIVLIHDAVRPFISETLIRESITQADRRGAVVVAVPARDTVKICAEAERVSCTPQRHQVWLAQTPQTFRREIIKRAYEAAYRDGFYGTDDASLAERIGIDVTIIAGSYDNIKITTPDDLVMAEHLLQKEERAS